MDSEDIMFLKSIAHELKHIHPCYKGEVRELKNIIHRIRLENLGLEGE